MRRYLDSSKIYVATVNGQETGAYVLKETAPGTCELMSIAVAPQYQRKGLGSELLRHAIRTAKESGAKRLELGTGTFGYQLGFYQKAGFRPFALEIGFFLKRYEDPVFENGIQHKDQMRMAITFSSA